MSSNCVSTDSIFLSVFACASAIFLSTPVVVAQPARDRLVTATAAASREREFRFMSRVLLLLVSPLRAEPDPCSQPGRGSLGADRRAGVRCGGSARAPCPRP